MRHCRGDNLQTLGHVAYAGGVFCFKTPDGPWHAAGYEAEKYLQSVRIRKGLEYIREFFNFIGLIIRHVSNLATVFAVVNNFFRLPIKAVGRTHPCSGALVCFLIFLSFSVAG